MLWILRIYVMTYAQKTFKVCLEIDFGWLSYLYLGINIFLIIVFIREIRICLSFKVYINFVPIL